MEHIELYLRDRINEEKHKLNKDCEKLLKIKNKLIINNDLLKWKKSLYGDNIKPHHVKEECATILRQRKYFDELNLQINLRINEILKTELLILKLCS